MNANAVAVRNGGPEDLIATVWFGLGFKPTESLVLAGLEGSRHRIGVILRADLPAPTASRSRLRGLIRGLIGPIVDSPADAVVALVVSEQVLNGPPPEIVSVVRRQIGVLGLRLFDVLGVSPTAYRSLLCRDPECCPAEGKPIEAVMASRSAAIHVLKGDVLAETEEELLLDVRPEPGLDPEPGPIPASERPGPAGPATLPLDERWHWWERWIDAFESAQAAGSDGPNQIPRLSGAMHDPFLRDAVMMHLLGAPQAQLSAVLNMTYGLGPDRASGDGFDADGDGPDVDGDGFDADRDGFDVDGDGFDADGGGPDVNWDGPDADWDGSQANCEGLAEDPDPRFRELLAQDPDRERLSAGQAVLAASARAAASGDRAPSLAVMALLAWYQGRTGRSRLLAERARADDPTLSLTALVEALLVGRVPPLWAQIRP